MCSQHLKKYGSTAVSLSDNVVEGPFLMGKKVTLRPLREEDAAGSYPSWLNDAVVCDGNSHHVYPYTGHQALEFIRSLPDRRDLLVLAIVDNASGRHVGNISLQEIHFVNRSAELAILVGAQDCWGKGLGTEACALLMRHGFTALNLRRIELGTPQTNIGMQKIALALGMKHEGTKRSAFFKNGKYLDVFLYGILRDDAHIL